MASPNTEFLEVLTEEALQIGFALQLREPTRAAFKILVTERALEILADERTAGKARKTLFGRERQPLPDDLDNLVQHAGRSLAERARKLYESLAGDDVFATLQVQEFAKLKALGNASEQWKRTSDVEALRRAQFRLERALLDDFHRRLNDAMNYLGDDGYGVSIDAVLGEYVTTREPSDVPSFMAVYLCLTDEQRSLCSPAYRQLYNSWPSLPELEQAVAPGHDSNMDQLAWEYDKALVRASITYLEGPPIDASQFVFSLQSFRAEVAGALHTMNVLWADRDSEFPFLITPHLCLPEQMVELKYLPLWAEGLDDGTGGVFQEFVPPAELGPNGPGPAFHTGITMPSTADGGNDGSSVLDSDIVMVPDAPSSYSFSDLASDLARANVRDDGHTPTQSVSGESAITAIGVARSSLAANDSITETATRASESSSVVVVSRPESEVSRLEPDVSRPESDVSWPEPDVSQTESDVSRPESEADDDVTMADD